MPKTTLVIGDNEITYNGIRYIPDPNVPDTIKLYMMRGNHTFIAVCGKSPDSINSNIRRIQKQEKDLMAGVTVHLLHGQVELSRKTFPTDTLTDLRRFLSTTLHRRLLKNNVDVYIKTPK